MEEKNKQKILHDELEKLERIAIDIEAAAGIIQCNISDMIIKAAEVKIPDEKADALLEELKAIGEVLNTDLSQTMEKLSDKFEEIENGL